MRSLRLLEWKSTPVLEEVDEPTPGPGQVVIKVGGAGACHSDVHLMDEFEPGAMQDLDESASVLADGTLRLLALPYADHSDYREEWRP